MTLPKAVTPLDALWKSFRQLVRAELPTLTFLGIYEYNVFLTFDGGVTARRTDSTLPIPDVVQIPMRSGIPGATVNPSKGSNVYVAFVNGDPSRPIIHSYDSQGAQSVAFDTGHGTGEHVTSIEAVCALLLSCKMLVGSPPLPITPVQLVAAINLSVSTTTIDPLTLAAITAALLAKGTPLAPGANIGFPNLTGG
jgi:hypothetical protein